MCRRPARAERGRKKAIRIKTITICSPRNPRIGAGSGNIFPKDDKAAFAFQGHDIAASRAEKSFVKTHGAKGVTGAKQKAPPEIPATSCPNRAQTKAGVEAHLLNRAGSAATARLCPSIGVPRQELRG